MSACAMLQFTQNCLSYGELSYEAAYSPIDRRGIMQMI
jgi:hypothetical protein